MSSEDANSEKSADTDAQDGSEFVTERTITDRLTELGGSVVWSDITRYEDRQNDEYRENSAVTVEFQMIAWDETVKRACQELVADTDWTARVNVERGSVATELDNFRGVVTVNFEYDRRLA